MLHWVPYWAVQCSTTMTIIVIITTEDPHHPLGIIIVRLHRQDIILRLRGIIIRLRLRDIMIITATHQGIIIRSSSYLF